MYGHEELPPMENQMGNSREAGFVGFASYIPIQWAEAVIFFFFLIRVPGYVCVALPVTIHLLLPHDTFLKLWVLSLTFGPLGQLGPGGDISSAAQLINLSLEVSLERPIKVTSLVHICI